MKKKPSFINFLETICSVFMLAFVVILLLIMTEKTTVTTDLYSLNLTSGHEGFFILGSGNIESELYYAAYGIAETGAKYLIKIPADDTYINEILEENDTAYMVEVKNRFGTVFSRELYLPKNTIHQNYDLFIN